MSARHTASCEGGSHRHRSNSAYITQSRFCSPVNTGSPYVYGIDPMYHTQGLYEPNVHTGLSFDPVSRMIRTAVPSQFNSNTWLQNTATALDYAAAGAVLNAGLAGAEQMYYRR